MTFDLNFDTAMSDGKFAINVGGNNFYIENKIKNESKINLCGNGDWGSRPIAYTNVATTINVTIARNGDSITITMAVGGNNVSFTSNAPAASSSIYFWMFNTEGSEQNATATVSNVVVTNN